MYDKLKYLLLAVLLSASCSGKDQGEPVNPPPPGIVPKDGVFEQRGEGSFVYTGYEPLKDKPITLYYYIPSGGEVERMPVLFSMHGAERDGTIQRNAWKYFAEEYGFVVLAPEYSKTYYTENDYQFGGVYRSAGSGVLNEEPKWTYRTVEALFDYLKSQTGKNTATYQLFGQ